MKRKTMSILICLTLVITAFVIAPSNVFAATDQEIEDSIVAGLAYLAGVQNGDGSWGVDDKEAHTGLVLIKMQDRAYELGYDSPFDPAYPYSTNVLDGWNYLFGEAYKDPISLQDHTGGASGNWDNPDTNGNGYGIFFGANAHHHTYQTGIVLMALAASGTPNRLNELGLDLNGDTNPDTYKEIAQDTCDWLAFAQGDSGHDEGGWFYTCDSNGVPVSNRPPGYYDTDNSNGGYAVLGLAAAEATTARPGATAFACTVPDWVKTELDVWIDELQDPVNGDADDGGSWYRPEWSWVNELKTGNLIFEMTFVGDTISSTRFQNALDYIERHWQDNNVDPGWGYNQDPAGYQAMYCLMKGLLYSGIELIDTDGDNIRDDSWYNQEPPASPAQDFASVIVGQQNGDGSWDPTNWGTRIACTAWCLLILEAIAPPPPVIDIYVDIKPGSCPNPINLKSKGILPVAICGTEDFDVTTIDPESILLTREGYEDVGVSPIRWTYEDVATPYEGELCGCHDLDGDGYLDLSLKFKNKEIVETLDLEDVVGEVIPLIITGNLKEEEGGTPIKGQDCFWVLEHQEVTEDRSFVNTKPIYQLVETFLQRFPLLRLLLSYLIF